MDFESGPDGVKSLVISPVRCTFAWKVIFWFLSIVSLGTVSFFYYWFDEYAHFWYTMCRLEEASHVRVFNKLTETDEVVKLFHQEIKLVAHERLKMRFFFRYKYHLYYWKVREQQFATVRNHTLKKLLKHKEEFEGYKEGLEKTDRSNVKESYGRNLIDVRLVPLIELFLKETLSPFTLYQLFCVVVWFYNDYVLYAEIMLVLIGCSLVGSVWEQRTQNQKIRTLALYEEQVWVLQKFKGPNSNSYFDRTSTLEIVPGDIILVPTNSILPCDALLLEGTCIIDESLLTGETFPVQKAAVEAELRPNFGNVLCAGTKCLSSSNQKRARNFYNGTSRKFEMAGPKEGESSNGETPFEERSYAVALALNTGFYTFKGELVHSLLMSEVDSFDFKKDTAMFLLCISIITFCAFVFYLILELKRGTFDTFRLVVRGLELFATSIQPGLPLSLTISLEITMVRLKKFGISTLNLSKINEAGRVKMMCFDKTGTLTESSLKFAGFSSVINVEHEKLALDIVRHTLVPSGKEEHSSEDGLHEDTVRPSNFGLETEYLKDSSTRKIWEIMSCCHSLSEVEGLVIGDPLEVQMFAESGSEMSEPSAVEAEIGIVTKIRSSPEFVAFLKTVGLVKADSSYSDGQDRHFFDEIPAEVSAFMKKKPETSEGPTETSEIERSGLTEPLLGVPGRSSEVSKTAKKPGGVPALSNSERRTRFDGSFFVLRKIDFTPQRKRFGCVVFNPVENEFEVQCKGAPATIKDCCDPNTIPADFNRIVGEMSGLGLRMIALASRRVTKDELTAPCDQLETNLVFAGFLMFENPLKPDTRASIETLRESRVKCVMITGDHILTSISVAVASGIIDRFKSVWICDGDLGALRWTHQKSSKNISKDIRVREQQIFNVNFNGEEEEDYPVHALESDIEIDFSMSEALTVRSAQKSSLSRKSEGVKIYTLDDVLKSLHKQNAVIAVTGTAFEDLKVELESEELDLILKNTLVFARANPEQKADIVENFKKQLAKDPEIHLVGYCGDGANDCPALKKAHVGLSLSQLESSMAAPFNSVNPSIANILNLIREGKASLETGVQLFKFLCLAALTQLLGLLVVFIFQMDMTNGQYFYTDLFTTFPIVLLMCLTEAQPRMTKNYPQSSLMSAEVLGSIIGILLINASFFVFLGLVLYFRTGFIAIKDAIPFESEDLDAANFDPAAFMNFYAVQVFILVCSVFIHRGFPFKKSWMTNRPFFYFVCICSTITVFIFFMPELANGTWIHGFLASSLCVGYIDDWFRKAYGISLLILVSSCVLYERVIMKWVISFGKHKQYVTKHTLQENKKL